MPAVRGCLAAGTPQDRFDRPFCLVECVGIVKPQPNVVDIDWIQAKITCFEEGGALTSALHRDPDQLHQPR